MKALVDRIRREGRVLPGGLLHVDGFVNHALDASWIIAMGEAFVHRFERVFVPPPDRIVTAEVSGIAPALATGGAMAVPVTFARKRIPRTLDPPLRALAKGRTKGGDVELTISTTRRVAGQRCGSSTTSWHAVRSSPPWPTSRVERERP